ncbi:hypothetical protein HAX54_027670 [Datura stramonium]|uniref:Uncharacterized protein n=1 Tax=Datura stramonium TaxID=4076 RepID=A0ABS8V3R8_DATST|nr:hypothetical protein [Datura stramonium]
MERTHLGGVREEASESAAWVVAHVRGWAGRGGRGRGRKEVLARARAPAIVPARFSGLAGNGVEPIALVSQHSRVQYAATVALRMDEVTNMGLFSKQ